jgi:hypothetical protein
MSVNAKGKYRYPRLRVSSNDQDVLERFKQVIGCGAVHVRKPPASAKHRQQYEFSVTRAEQARDAFYAMYPWLGTRRRERGLEVLAECAKVKTSRSQSPNSPLG